MRSLPVFVLIALPAHAWEFTPGLPCLLTHETAAARVKLTHDPTQPLYTITITRNEPWPDVPVFSMRFDGPRPIGIGTGRHRLHEGGTVLTVIDTGFGNVLDGLQFNHTAYAFAGGVEVSFPLEGAAVPVAAFRACEGEPLSS